MSEVTNPKRLKVAACCPSFDTVNFHWMERSWFPLCHLVQPDFDKLTQIIRGSTSVAQKRNQMVVRALNDKDVTHIFMIDNDVLYEGCGNDINHALRFMMGLNLDICGGEMRTRGLVVLEKKGFLKKEIRGYPFMLYQYLPESRMWANLPPKLFMNRSALVQVDGIGMGFTLIKREVFEALPKPWYLEDEWTEDFYFCKKATDNGFKIWAVNDIRCSHINQMKIKHSGQAVSVDTDEG